MTAALEVERDTDFDPIGDDEPVFGGDSGGLHGCFFRSSDRGRGGVRLRSEAAPGTAARRRADNGNESAGALI